MEERNLRKTRVGVVVSDKMDKTIVVAVKDSVQHPLYNLFCQKRGALSGFVSDLSREATSCEGEAHRR